MSRVLGILIVLMPLGMTKGQGYSRILGEDFAIRITSLQDVGSGNFRLAFTYTWAGSGADHGRDYYALYHPSKDSLGLEHQTTSWGVNYDYNRSSLKLSETEFLFSRQECCSEYSRQGMSIRHIDLYRDYRLKEYSMPFQSGAFDLLHAEDTIYILRSIDSINHLSNRQYEDNSVKVLCFYHLANDSIIPLDTIDFGIDFKAPGTLLYDSLNREFELLYDSLQFFFRRGDTVPRRSGIHKGSFWHGSRQSSISSSGSIDIYHLNYRRNLYLRWDSCWSVDTLGYRWVEACENRQGEVRLKFPSFPPDPPFKDYRMRIKSSQSGATSLYAAFHKNNGSLYLLEYQEDSLIDALHLKESPYNMGIYDLQKNEDGSFYLVGSVGYNSFGDYGYGWLTDPIFVKIDPQRQVQSSPTGTEIYAYYSPYGQLYPFLEKADLEHRYRILNSSGKIIAEGTFLGREGFSIQDLLKGVYQFQVWTLTNDLYRGQGKFIKP